MLSFLILGRLEILKVNSERRSVPLISQKKTSLRNKQLLALTLAINSTGRQSNTGLLVSISEVRKAGG